VASQPDRDEPRRFIITGNRHGRQGRLDSPLVEVVQGPPIQMGERIEVVESRGPSPSDEDVEAGARALFALEQDPAPWDALSETEKEALRKGARAVLDAVSSHRDEDEDSAGAECSRLEDDMLEIHDALVDAGLPGTINAQNIIERINALASHRDDEARER
jgi:hypothetical protein